MQAARQGPGRPLRWMAAHDRIRLIDLLRKSPATAGFFYAPAPTSAAAGTPVDLRQQALERRRGLLVAGAARRSADGADADLDVRPGRDADDAAAHLRDRLAGRHVGPHGHQGGLGMAVVEKAPGERAAVDAQDGRGGPEAPDSLLDDRAARHGHLDR